jgi:cysteine-rich repeat protein
VWSVLLLVCPFSGCLTDFSASDPAPTCGDGIVNNAETCDGTNLDGRTCTDFGYAEAAGLSCNAQCRFDTTGCRTTCGNGISEPGEGCDDGNGRLDDGCPDGPQGTCQNAFCGDGFVWSGPNGGEACEPGLTVEVDCRDFGFVEPAGVSCDASCLFDTAGCTAQCGNNALEPGEMCDGTDLGSIDCTDFGFLEPNGVSCDASCLLDSTGCTAQCGNNALEPGEDCEDGNTVEWDGCSTACRIVEFRANTYTLHDQREPALAVAADGSFVVTWESENQDGSYHGVFGQRFDAQGIAQGPEFQINDYTAHNQWKQNVAIAADGAFVVVWASHDQDGSNDEVYAKRFAADGTALGAEFRVNTETALGQSSPDVAMAEDGGFVVVWDSDEQDGSGWGVFGQRYDPNGAPLGSEFGINTYTTGDQFRPGVAMAQDETFVVIWVSRGQDGSQGGLFGQRFAADGTPMGNEFPVNTYTAGHQGEIAISMAPDGFFVVVWTSDDQDGFNRAIAGRRFSPDTTALGDDFVVNSTTAQAQDSASVAVFADHTFVVVWESEAQDGSGEGSFGQRFDAGGAPVGPEFPLNFYTTQDQDEPAVAGAADGRFVSAWQSDQQDGNGQGVFCQRFTAAATPLGRLL